MSKTRNWPTRVLHVVFALALVVGLAVTAAPPVAEAGPADPGTFGIEAGNYTLIDGAIDGYWERTPEGTTVGPRVLRDASYKLWLDDDPDTETDPADYEGDFEADMWIGAGEIHFEGWYSDYGMGDFSLGTISDVDGTLTIGADGEFTLEYSAYSGLFGQRVYFEKSGTMYKPQIYPDDVAFNVKGATHKACINHVSYRDDPMDNPWIVHIDWWLTKTKGLTGDSVFVREPSGPNPEASNRTFDETIRAKGLIDNVPCIEIQAMDVGDVHMFVEVRYWDPEEEEYVNLEFVHEKKYFEITRSDLDLEPDKPGVTNTMTVEIPGDADGWLEPPQKIVDTIRGKTPGIDTPRLVDGALMHWWLIKDSTENKAKIRSLMQYIADHDDSEYAFYELYSAAGKYVDEPGDLLDGKQPWEWINDWATLNHADPDLFELVDVEYDPSEIVEPWYARSTSEGGKAEAYLRVNQDELEECIPETVMIVVLVTYPGPDPTKDPFHGENRIAIQIAQKTYHKDYKPEIEDVKTIQLRWAGEKIVLEKDWSHLPGVPPASTAGYEVSYNLESQSVGTLHQIGGEQPHSGDKVWTDLDPYGVSKVILESEASGQADVNAALYKDGQMVHQIGFVVYFLEFEDVTLSEVTPPDSITDLQAGEEDAHVAVEVRGFFDYRNSHLIPTTREARPIDLDGDGEYDVILPAGRYVLPDDWWILAGTRDVSLRPNWDLMDSAHHDNIYSLNPLGPYIDGDDPNNLLPWTTNPPGEAEFPTIGPFSSLQQWSTEAKWISEATIDTSLDPGLSRTTVVPDGEIDKWDAPMPPALVMFNIDTEKSPDNASLSELWKFMLEGYGYTIYDSGTATADGTTTTLTDENKSWIPGELVDGFVWIDRAGENYYGQITANTATTLTFVPVTWPTTLPALTAPGVRSGDSYWIPRFESPFYAVEIPAHEAIVPGYPGWHSWPAGPGGDGPYPFWADLQMESRWNRLPEPDPLSVWVYSDNHGIAGVTIDDLDVQGCVTITATADFPYTPKMGKYGPRVSHDITACWGPPVFPELNPHFVPDNEEVEVDEVVTFTNFTTGGTLPYTEAVWDFGDGTVKTIEGTHDEVMAPVTHAYSEEGEYYVKLTMTDSAPMTRSETRDDPIRVGDPDPNDPNDYVDNPPIGEGLASIAEELLIVYVWRPATQSWDMYWPAAEIDDIGMLQAGTAYWLLLESDCTLEYGTRSWDLIEGWENIAWLPQ